MPDSILSSEYLRYLIKKQTKMQQKFKKIINLKLKKQIKWTKQRSTDKEEEVGDKRILKLHVI